MSKYVDLPEGTKVMIKNQGEEWQHIEGINRLYIPDNVELNPTDFEINWAGVVCTPLNIKEMIKNYKPYTNQRTGYIYE